MAIIDIDELRRLSADAESLLLFCKRPGLLLYEILRQRAIKKSSLLKYPKIWYNNTTGIYQLSGNVRL